MGTIYHYSSMLHLPWILSEGELRGMPGLGVEKGFPPYDFLWATTSPHVDKTSTTYTQYRSGTTTAVRFILPAESFFPWAEASERYPEWTPRVVGALNRAAVERGADHSQWFCRRAPLAVDGLPAGSIQIRRYTDRAWRTVSPNVLVKQTSDGLPCIGVEIEGREYFSTRHRMPNGAIAHAAA